MDRRRSGIWMRHGAGSEQQCACGTKRCSRALAQRPERTAIPVNDARREERVAPMEHRFADRVGGPSGPPTWTATSRKWGIRAAGSRGFVGGSAVNEWADEWSALVGARAVQVVRAVRPVPADGTERCGRGVAGVASMRRGEGVAACGACRRQGTAATRRLGPNVARAGGGRVAGLRGVLRSNTVAGRNRRARHPSRGSIRLGVRVWWSSGPGAPSNSRHQKYSPRNHV